MTGESRRKRVSGSVTARPRAPDPARAQAAVRDLLEALGFDPDDPALATAPARTAEAFIDVLTRGYAESPVEALGHGFPVENDNPVVARDIPFLFVCPHHLMPARGVAHVAFLPDGQVPGLSRLTRLLDVVGRRLVLQEDVAEQVVQALAEALGVRAAVAVIEAQHTCVAIEDLARRDTVFRTRAFTGPAALVASLDAEIDASLRGSWSTSVSEPPARAPASRSPSRSAPASSGGPRRPTTSPPPPSSPSDDS